MKKLKVFTLCALSAALMTACGDDDSTLNGANNSQGSVSISADSANLVDGVTMTATISDSDGINDSSTLYQWNANGFPISGATSASYVISDDYAGSTLSVSAVYTDGAGFIETVVSASSEAIIANEIGQLTIVGDAADKDSILNASLVDGNGVPGELSYVWSADGVAIEGETGASLQLTPAVDGQVITVAVSYTDDDGFTESLTSAATGPVGVANTPATFDELAVTVTNDSSAQSGSITVIDVDAGDDALVSQTDTTTSYGTFSIDEEGEWSYSLNTSDATIAALADSSDSVDDTVVIESVDGTVASLVISITGVDINEKIATIRDTDSGDTGELRYKFDAPLLAGKLVASFNKPADAIEINDEFAAKDAYITFYNEATSTSGGRAIADLRIQTDKFVLRDQDDIVVNNPFTPGEWQNVEVTWEAANDVTPPMVTVTIDGVSVTTEAFSSPDAAVGGVAAIAFRIADNTAILPDDKSFKVDDISIYSDAVGTTLVHEDDFESYSDGYDLDPDNNGTSVYNSSTFQAVVEPINGVVDTPTDNQFAAITDTDSGDSGELRYRFESPMLAGKLVASFNKPADAIEINDELAAKDAYITLFNSAHSTSSGRAIADLRIQTDQFVLRDQDDIVVSNPFTPGQWQDVEITWEAGNDVTPPMVTVTIDGVSVTTEAFTSPDAAVGGVSAVAFRFADNTAILPDDISFKVDDIAIYSDVAGTTLVHEDDFESYSNGTDLDPDNNGNSVYNSSSFQAVVTSNSGSTDGGADGGTDGGSDGGSDNGSNGDGGSFDGNLIAAITDTDSGDSGELRYRFESPMLVGKLVASFNKPANAIETNDELAAKDAYVTLFNSSHSTSSGRAIADLRIQTDQFVLRDQDDIVVNNPFTPDEWQNVEITWEAGNDVTPPMVTVTIDGISVTAEAFSSPDAAVGGVSAIAFRFADNTAILPDDISFKVDDVSIYSDVAGTTLVFEDDFQGYSDGTDLDPDNNGNSVYNSSTFQAVVKAEQ
ncbi:MAG: VCBS domain-containing protein [Paraglaciecola sp.]|uniref:VCBS domain-containing protein n=1 Tax=Paraglaciecola sp. TaxID=1920173 RepID=UPI003296D573